MKLEQELREEAILRHIGISLDAPNRDVLTAYWKGRIEAIIDLWKTRDLIRRQSTATKKAKGGSHANNEVQEENDE